MSSIQAKPDAWGARKIEATSCSQSAPEKSKQQDQYCEHSMISSHEAAPRTGYAAVAQDRGSSEPCWDFKGASAQASPRKEGGTPWQGPDTA